MYSKRRKSAQPTSILSTLNESMESLVAPLRTSPVGLKRNMWSSTPNLTDPNNEGEHVVLSYNQEQELQVGQLPIDHPLHLVSEAMMIDGSLEIRTLEKCFQEVVDAHDSLRTSFVGLLGSKPVQLIHPNMEIEMNVINLIRNVPDDSTLQEKMLEDAQRPFDISTGPLIRVSLYKLKANSVALLVTTHRAICDKSSLRLLNQVVFGLYEAAIYNRSVSLPIPGMQYSEFATWQRKQLPDEKIQRKFEEWKNSMRGIPLVVQLPTDFPLPATPTYKGARYSLTFPNEITEKLKKLSLEEQVPLGLLLLTTYQVLLYRYAGQTEFAYGTTVSSQLLPGLKRLIGCFSNVIVIKANFSDNPTFIEALQQVKRTFSIAEDYADLPIEKLLKDSSNSVEPFVNTLFSFDENDGILAPLNGIRFSRVNLNISTCKYELHLNLTMGESGIHGFIDYNPDLFVLETIRRMAGHYEMLLKHVTEDQTTKISSFSLITREEQKQFFNWSNNFQEEPKKCVHQLVEEQVEKRPNQIAVVFNSTTLTYKELNNRANQLAHYLIKLGIKPETLVGISLERRIEMVVAVLAVLKAGGGFCFVDPNFPQDRITFMLTNIKSKLILSQKSLKNSLSSMQDITTVYLDEKDSFLSYSEMNPNIDVKTNNIAYVQYTSGSTGNPKGVVIEHRQFAQYLLGSIDVFCSANLSNQLAATTLSYVPGILEIFFPLVCGKKMTIAKNAFELPNIPTAGEVNYVGAVPSIMIELLRMNAILPSVHSVGMFGEPVTKQLVQQIYEQTHVQEILLHFGCTEAGTCVIAPVRKDYRRNPPIGRPVKNTQFFLLDQEKHLVPVGIPGELHIVTAGLSRGYMNRNDLTAERFLQNPFREGLDENDEDLKWPKEFRQCDWLNRIYKTGDLMRYRVDGTLDILGRIDHQVKIRGIRVELGEIETAIQRHEAVHEVVVTAFQPTVGDKKLVAYIVCKKGLTYPSNNDIKNFLKDILPQYMLPSLFIFLDKMPLTANGKIDRKLLPPPEMAQTNSCNAVAARSEIEKKMCNLWANILTLKSVGIDDNFYEIGGNSLRAIQLMLKVSESFKVSLPATCIFENPTVEGLCRIVESALHGNLNTSEAFDQEEEAVLDEDIFPARAYIDVETLWNPRDIFLTGSTGFLGAFLLVELLQNTTAHIHCLIRAKSVKEGNKRLQENLKTYKLWNLEIFRRVSVVIGDLEKPMLGLSRTNFFLLGQRIDVIYHCGAPVNFVKPYSTLKAGSVLGTQEILRLACLFKVKPVHYVSSVVVLASTEKKIVHEMDDLNSPNGFFHMGYTRAKWVAEMLLWIAKSRGFPVTILRPGYVVGHSRKGTTNTNDYFARLVKGCIEAGSYPNMNDMMWLIPVDYVSRAIVQITRLPQSLGKAFHLAPLPGTDVTTVQLLDMVQDFGYSMRKRSPSEWVEDLEENVKTHDNALLPLLPYISHKYRDDYKAQSKPTADYDSTNTLSALNDSVITCPRVDKNIITSILKHYINIGWIPPPSK